MCTEGHHDGEIDLFPPLPARQSPVGQRQWDGNLATVYTNPGNVNNVRWCTGALINPNLAAVTRPTPGNDS